MAPGTRRPDISAPIASEARYWSGGRSGLGLNGADRSELLGLGSMPMGGVGKSRAGGRDTSLDPDKGCSSAGTGGGIRVSWKAASRTPRSFFGPRTWGGLAPGMVGFGFGGVRPG